jgi:TRAP transporter TAXI family solute receptor
MLSKHRLLSLFAVILLLLVACAPAATPAPAAEEPAAEEVAAEEATEAPAEEAAAPVADSAAADLTYTEPCTPDKANGELPSGKLRLVVGTGGTGGVFFPYGGGLARVFTEKLENAEATAEVTGGSVDNMKLIQVGDADLGLSTVDSAYDALIGAGAYADTGAVEACALAVLYTSFVHVVALEESGINTVADMAGKRISVGSAGSSTEGAADRILVAAGLDPQADITRDNLSVAESVAAMKDRKIDAFFWIGGLPTAAVTDLVSTPNLPVKFLDTSEFVEGLRAEFGPVYTAFNIPAGTYAGFDSDIPGIGIGNILFVNASMPVELAHDLVETIFTNLDEVRKSHPEAEKLSLEAAVQGSSIPFHPGAIQYYAEQGAWTEQ